MADQSTSRRRALATTDDVAAVRALGDEWRQLRAAHVAFHDGVFMPMARDNPGLADAYARQEAMDDAATVKLMEAEAYPVTTIAGLNAKLDVMIEAYGEDGIEYDEAVIMVADIRRIGEVA